MIMNIFLIVNAVLFHEVKNLPRFIELRSSFVTILEFSSLTFLKENYMRTSPFPQPNNCMIHRYDDILIRSRNCGVKSGCLKDN